MLDSEYIKLARVKGVPENVVIWNHAMRNAAIPVVTFLGLILGNFLTGFVVVETIFSWPGVGLLAIRGIQSNDFAIIQTVVMFGGLLFITINFLVDIFYGYSTADTLRMTNTRHLLSGTYPRSSAAEENIG